VQLFDNEKRPYLAQNSPYLAVQNRAFCIKTSQNCLTFLPLNKKCIPLRAIFVKYIFLQIKNINNIYNGSIRKN
jgi:hypothetical protein